MDSVSPAEMGISPEEANGAIKSLGGKDLPKDWPPIISEEEESRIYQKKITQPGKDLTIDKLSLILKNGNKELRYLGVQHISGSENKNHPQFAALKRHFDELKPQVVLYEGPQGNPQSMTEEQGYLHGEKAFIQYLVLDHNSKLQTSESPIEMASADLPDEEAINEYTKRGYTTEEIAVGDVLRTVYSVAAGIKITQGLTEEQKQARLMEEETKINQDVFAFMQEKGYPSMFHLLPRKDGQSWNTDLIKQEIKRLTGQDLSMSLDSRQTPRFQEMWDDARIFRDQYIARKIAETLNKHDRVMAVMGSSHVVREKDALEKYFDLEPN